MCMSLLVAMLMGAIGYLGISIVGKLIASYVAGKVVGLRYYSV